MKIETSFLRTRVARRIVALFFLCALLPSAILTIIAFTYVTNQLEVNGRERREEIGRLTKDAVLERLNSLRTHLGIVGSGVDDGADGPASFGLDTTVSRRFNAIIVQVEGRATVPLLGSHQSLPVLDDGMRNRLSAGQVVLSTQADPSGAHRARVLISRALDATEVTKGVLWAEINPAYLMTGGESPPRDTDLCVFDAANQPLYCSRPVAESVSQRLNAQIASGLEGRSDRGHFEWSAEGEEYLAWYQSVYFATRTLPAWNLVVSESKATVLAGREGFWNFFFRVVILILLLVAFLSYWQIRMSMTPLAELTDGTQRIARRDFATPVSVDSRDEFEDLAGSFNDMAETLRKQFSALTAINEIDRAVLAALSTEKIVDAILAGSSTVLSCDGVSVGLASANGSSQWKLAAIASSGGEKIVRDIEVPGGVFDELRANPNHLWVDGDAHDRSYLDVPRFHAHGIRSFLALPIFIRGELSGVIALGYTSRPPLNDEDLVQARQLADQVGVALSNTRLIEELNALNLGALTTLARAIDAKSPWTAGHSTRVTKTSLIIAERLGLPEKELEMINRGGLLHDIGKIGVPASILDKPGALDDDEWVLMKNHVTIGARILEPMAAYADIIPIVLRHHERWNGSGYPDGLAGEEIDFHARILAVADVYDALTSARPYRDSMPTSDVVAMIREDSGTHFDPVVVQAFLAIVAESPLETAEPVAPAYRLAVPAANGS